MAVKELTRLFNKLWDDEKVSGQMEEMLDGEIPKRGDLKQHKNWHCYLWQAKQWGKSSKRSGPCT